ncbi:MAG: MFS transporter [Cyanobacteria bacterium]|nr:MFS transporter [Cyanobacteriota bacterium]
MTTASSTSTEFTDDHISIRVLLPVFLLMTLLGANAGWTGPLLPSLAKDQSVSLVDVSKMISVNFLGCILSLLFGRFLMNSLGGWNCQKLSAILFAAGLLVIATVSGLTWICVGALLIGIGGGINSFSSTVVVLCMAKGSTSAVLNRLHLFYGLGALLGPAIAWLGTMTPWTYRAVFLLGAVLVSLIAVEFFAGAKCRPAVETKEAQSSWGIVKSPTLWMYSLVMFLYVGIETATVTWLYTYLQKAEHLSAGLSSLGVSALWGGLTLGRLLGVPLCVKFKGYYVTVGGVCLATVGMALLAWGPSCGFPCWMMFFAILCVGTGFGPVFPNVLAAANTRFAHAATTTTTVSILCGFVGGMIFAPVLAKIFENAGLSQGFMTLVGCLISLIFTFIVTRKIATSTTN